MARFGLRPHPLHERIRVLYIVEGRTATEVGDLLGIPRGTVISHAWQRRAEPSWQRNPNARAFNSIRRPNGNRREEEPRASVLPLGALVPPSTAMIRLAEFDPVIARALRGRRAANAEASPAQGK